MTNPIILINKDNFEAEVMQSDRPVLIDFWAPWCGACRMMSPIVEELAEKRPDIKVAKINIDGNKELARKYRVLSIPALFYIKNGQVVSSHIGTMPPDQLNEMCR